MTATPIAKMMLTIVVKLSSKSQYQSRARRFTSMRAIIRNTSRDVQKLPLTTKRRRNIAIKALDKETEISLGKSLNCSQVIKSCYSKIIGLL